MDKNPTIWRGLFFAYLIFGLGYFRGLFPTHGTASTYHPHSVSFTGHHSAIWLTLWSTSGHNYLNVARGVFSFTATARLTIGCSLRYNLISTSLPTSSLQCHVSYCNVYWRRKNPITSWEIVLLCVMYLSWFILSALCASPSLHRHIHWGLLTWRQHFF